MPIIYAGSLAKRALEVFKTHRNMMSDDLRKDIEQGRDPFAFKQME